MKLLPFIFFISLSLYVKGQSEQIASNGFLLKIVEYSKLYENHTYYFIPDSSYQSTLFPDDLINQTNHYIGEFTWLANWSRLSSENQKQLDSLLDLNSFLTKNKIDTKYDKVTFYIIHSKINGQVRHMQIKDYCNEFISTSVSGVDPHLGSPFLFSDVIEVHFASDLRKLKLDEQKAFMLSNYKRKK